MLGSFAELLHLTIQWPGTTSSPTPARPGPPTTSFLVLGPPDHLRRALHLDLQRPAEPAGRGGLDAPGLGRSRQLQRRGRARTLPHRPARGRWRHRGAVLVDNASSDGSAAIAERLADEHERVRLQRSTTNRGYAGAVNLALPRRAASSSLCSTWTSSCAQDGSTRSSASLRGDSGRRRRLPSDPARVGPAADQRGGPEPQQDRPRVQPLAGQAERDRGRGPVRGGRAAWRRVRHQGELLERLRRLGREWLPLLRGRRALLAAADRRQRRSGACRPRPSPTTTTCRCSPTSSSCSSATAGRCCWPICAGRTRLALSPLLALTELMMWGYCLLRGPSSCERSGRATLGEGDRAQIASGASRLDSVRRRSDREVLRGLRWGYPLDQFLTLGRERRRVPKDRIAWRVGLVSAFALRLHILSRLPWAPSPEPTSLQG